MLDLELMQVDPNLTSWIFRYNPTIVIFEPTRGVDDEHRVRGVSNGILKYIFAPDARQRKGHNDGGSC